LRGEGGGQAGKDEGWKIEERGGGSTVETTYGRELEDSRDRVWKRGGRGRKYSRD
jgi:hypothetical protein